MSAKREKDVNGGSFEMLKGASGRGGGGRIGWERMKSEEAYPSDSGRKLKGQPGGS